jgi:hypothetical protein
MGLSKKRKPAASELRRTGQHAGPESSTPSAPGQPGTSACPGCGLVQPEHSGPAHPYIGASPACWALYGRLMAREFSDLALFRVHQMSTDTYAVQHPGSPERRSIQSVALHLMTLCLVVERGADPLDGSRLHNRMAGRRDFHWLEPPQPNGSITVADVLQAKGPAEHRRVVAAWARDVWDAWSPHRQTVLGWIERSLG